NYLGFHTHRIYTSFFFPFFQYSFPDQLVPCRTIRAYVTFDRLMDTDNPTLSTARAMGGHETPSKGATPSITSNGILSF
ncbi:hypothetical protein, partial [Caproiciproducens galactitolivorans]|uniref:hypothetical protein n=1 Tax=Caproiciproducens galactitolivorans TaxID=642589 RepID=UPI001A9AB9EF